MDVIFAANAKEDKKYWEQTDPKMLEKINKLLDDIKRQPFKGLGKPEPLKFEKSGYWSRRINHVHRLVYKVVNKTIYVAQCRYHY